MALVEIRFISDSYIVTHRIIICYHFGLIIKGKEVITSKLGFTTKFINRLCFIGEKWVGFTKKSWSVEVELLHFHAHA